MPIPEREQYKILEILMLVCPKIYNHRRLAHKNFKETVDEKNNFGIPIYFLADLLF